MPDTITTITPSSVSITLTPQPEGGYTVTSPDVPELVTEGETVAECIEMAEDALRALRESHA